MNFQQNQGKFYQQINKVFPFKLLLILMKSNYDAITICNQNLKSVLLESQAIISQKQLIKKGISKYVFRKTAQQKLHSNIQVFNSQANQIDNIKCDSDKQPQKLKRDNLSPKKIILNQQMNLCLKTSIFNNFRAKRSNTLISKQNGQTVINLRNVNKMNKSNKQYKSMQLGQRLQQKPQRINNYTQNILCQTQQKSKQIQKRQLNSNKKPLLNSNKNRKKQSKIFINLINDNKVDQIQDKLRSRIIKKQLQQKQQIRKQQIYNQRINQLSQKIQQFQTIAYDFEGNIIGLTDSKYQKHQSKHLNLQNNHLIIQNNHLNIQNNHLNIQSNHLTIQHNNRSVSNKNKQNYKQQKNIQSYKTSRKVSIYNKESLRTSQNAHQSSINKINVRQSELPHQTLYKIKQNGINQNQNQNSVIFSNSLFQSLNSPLRSRKNSRYDQRNQKVRSRNNSRYQQRNQKVKNGNSLNLTNLSNLQKSVRIFYDSSRLSKRTQKLQNIDETQKQQQQTIFTNNYKRQQSTIPYIQLNEGIKYQQQIFVQQINSKAQKIRMRTVSVEKPRRKLIQQKKNSNNNEVGQHTIDNQTRKDQTFRSYMPFSQFDKVQINHNNKTISVVSNLQAKHNYLNSKQKIIKHQQFQDEQDVFFQFNGSINNIINRPQTTQNKNNLKVQLSKNQQLTYKNQQLTYSQFRNNCILKQKNGMKIFQASKVYRPMTSRPANQQNLLNFRRKIFD